MDSFKLEMIPAPLTWRKRPDDWTSDFIGRLSITAGRKTDWFIDPAGSVNIDNAPCAWFTPPDTVFTLSALVRVGFKSTYDAGVIHVRTVNETVGAKLCFEFSPQRHPMVVSVVTRGVSDDCNSATLDKEGVYLRVTRKPPVFAFHYSLDGNFWHFVRYFSLGDHDQVSVGFSSQSPLGEGCAAEFTRLSYSAGAAEDFRNGC